MRPKHDNIWGWTAGLPTALNVIQTKLFLKLSIQLIWSKRSMSCFFLLSCTSHSSFIYYKNYISFWPKWTSPWAGSESKTILFFISVSSSPLILLPYSVFLHVVLGGILFIQGNICYIFLSSRRPNWIRLSPHHATLTLCKVINEESLALLSDGWFMVLHEDRRKPAQCKEDDRKLHSALHISDCCYQQHARQLKNHIQEQKGEHFSTLHRLEVFSFFPQ